MSDGADDGWTCSCERDGYCAWCQFRFEMNVAATEERIRKMTPDEWTQILVWAMDFESRAIRLEP